MYLYFHSNSICMYVNILYSLIYIHENIYMYNYIHIFVQTMYLLMLTSSSGSYKQVTIKKKKSCSKTILGYMSVCPKSIWFLYSMNGCFFKLPFIGKLQGVLEKLCFFTIHSNPFLAYIAVRALQSSQRNASVQSLLLAG